MTNPIGPAVPVDARPTSKVAAAGAVGAPLALIMAWLVNDVFKWDVPSAVQAAVGALVAAAVGYFTPPGPVLTKAATPRKRPAIKVTPPREDKGETFTGVAWTVVAVLGCIALVVWIVNNT